MQRRPPSPAVWYHGGGEAESLAGREQVDRHAAYALLAAELNRWRGQPYETLARHVGAEPSVVSAVAAGEPISVEVRVRLQNASTDALRIEATAYGPNWWKLERMDESITVSPP